MKESLYIRPYENEDKENLLKFYIKVYPFRSPKYLEWWVNKADLETREGKNRTYLLIHENKIIGATSGLWDKIRIGDNITNFYWAGNTIIAEDYRGKGGGRLIYSQMAKHYDRISTGFTEKAFRIQPRLIPNLRPIPDVYVYLSFNSRLEYIFNRLKNNINYLKTPDKICSGDVKFELVSKPEDINVIGNGSNWTQAGYEICRDPNYFKERFFNCYRPYWIYNCYSKENGLGYMVLRPTFIKGIPCLSLVDFRFSNNKILREIKKAALHIAKLNNICILITLTSLPNFSSCYPLTIKMPKKLHGATSIEEYVAKENLLITSADSDLDFVYYP